MASPCIQIDLPYGSARHLFSLPGDSRSLRRSGTLQSTVERAVDAYLEGDWQVAVRVLEIPIDAVRVQADDTFKRWLDQAMPIKDVGGEVDDAVGLPPARAVGAHLRRATVRRLQGTAALVVEI